MPISQVVISFINLLIQMLMFFCFWVWFYFFGQEYGTVQMNLWVLALPLLPAFRHCLHRRRVAACVVYGSLAAMVVMTVVDCEMAGVLYRYLMDYSPVLLLGAALCWFCAEGALSRRAALGEGTAAAALPVLRTVMAAAAAYTAVYRFCTLFAMEPWLQGMNPSLYYTVSRLVQFWM